MIITVANQKGGVGKTDLSVNLSSFLARMGKKVLLIDLDPQANSTDYLYSGKAGLNTNHLLLENDVKISDLALETGIGNLFLAPAAPELSAAQVELMNDVGMQFKLKRKLKSARNRYDFIIIDTPPSLGVLTINALAASDCVMIPVQVHYFAMDGVQKLLNTVDAVRREINPRLDVRGFVLTMYDRRNKLSYRMERKIRESFGDKVFRTSIPVNVDLADSPSSHKPVMLSSRNSRGAYAYENLAREFLAP
jgi:chromosome partitioning protein